MTAAKKAASKKGLVVTAPLVQVELGGQAAQFRSGDVLPSGVSEDSLEHLRDLGYVSEGEVPAEPDESE